MTSKDILYKGAQLKRDMKQLEDEYKMLAPSIEGAIRELASEERAAVEVGELGTFRIDVKKSWKYSVFIEEQEAALKEDKEKEQADGTAVFEESPIVKFIIKKDEE